MNYKNLMKIATSFETLTKNPYYIGKSQISGNGVLAQHFIPKNTNIGIAITNGPDIVSFMGSHINHQFKCNAKLVENENNGYDLVAINDIHPGQEITVNYKDTPWYINKNTKGFAEL